MRRVVGVLVGLFVFTSCVPTTTYLAHYDIALTGVEWSAHPYDIALASVERPADAKERYGEYVIVASSAEDTTRYRYEDELVRISWLPTPYDIRFVLENKTDHSIKIVWDEAAFTDQTGVSHRVMHSGTKIADRFSSQPPTVVPRKSRISDLIYPADYYDSGKRRDLLPVRRDISKAISTRTHSAMVAEFESSAMSAIGKTWEILLPLQIEDVVNEYLFVFTVKDAQKERYGGYVTVASSAEDTTRYRYEDGLVRISCLPTLYELAFVLENETDHSIKIVWDEAVFTDRTGVSHRVMHSGTKIADRFSSQPPTVVPRKSRVSDLIYPADYYDMGDHGWERRDLLPVRRGISNAGGRKIHNAKVADFESLIMSAIGKTWEVLLPLQIEDAVNAYLFVFTVEDAQIEALEKKGSASGGARKSED